MPEIYFENISFFTFLSFSWTQQELMDNCTNIYLQFISMSIVCELCGVNLMFLQSTNLAILTFSRFSVFIIFRRKMGLTVFEAVDFLFLLYF
jgi:hypothetical protein